MNPLTIESVCELSVFDKIKEDERFDLILSFLNDVPEGRMGATLGDTGSEMRKKYPELRWESDDEPWIGNKVQHCIGELGEKMAKVGVVRYFTPRHGSGFTSERLIITEVGRLYLSQRETQEDYPLS